MVKEFTLFSQFMGAKRTLWCKRNKNKRLVSSVLGIFNSMHHFMHSNDGHMTFSWSSQSGNYPLYCFKYSAIMHAEWKKLDSKWSPTQSMWAGIHIHLIKERILEKNKIMKQSVTKNDFWLILYEWRWAQDRIILPHEKQTIVRRDLTKSGWPWIAQQYMFQC